MFDKYIELIKKHQDNKKEIQDFLNDLDLKKIIFNVDGENITFTIPSAFKIRVQSKKTEILNFFKKKNLNTKGL